MSVNISEWRKRFCWLKVWNFYLFCSDPFCAFFFRKKTAWVKQLIILIFGKFSFATVQMLYNKSRFFFAHRLKFVGKLPQNVSAVCCIEWFVALLQETLTPSVKQFLIVCCTEVEGELWWFLLLNIYIQWDFTVRKISPVNTSFAMVGLKREKKSSLCHLTSYVTFASHLSRVKIVWASNSGRFFSALLKIQFCVRNTL